MCEDFVALGKENDLKVTGEEDEEEERNSWDLQCSVLFSFVVFFFHRTCFHYDC